MPLTNGSGDTPAGVPTKPDANDAARAAAAAEDEAARLDKLVLADHSAALVLDEYVRIGRLPGVHVTRVADSGAFESDYGVAEAMIAAGKPVYTWCTDSHEGRAVARVLHDDITANSKSIRHIVRQAPDRWTGVPEADVVFENASPSKPAAIRKPALEAPRASIIGADDASTFDVSTLRLAEFILERPDWASRCLLVTRDNGEFFAVHTLDSNGIWGDPEATVLGWLGTISDELESAAYRLAAERRLQPTSVTTMVKSIHAIKNPKTVRPVCRSFAAAVGRLRAQGTDPKIRECRPSELDGDLRYMGVKNGVVDLDKARLITAAEASNALVTTAAPAPYDPERYPPADWFLSHVPARERDWWLDVIGYGLRGIAKRFYGCIAAPDSGKTTAINLLRTTFGPYVDSPLPGTLDAHQRYGTSGHTPGLIAWLSPVRLTIIDEMKERELHAELMKDVTGGGQITARDTYKRRVTKQATGTTFIFANDSRGDQKLPQLRTDDQGMKVRYRELPFPTLPKDQQIQEMRDNWPRDPERQAQLMTLLVQRAAANPKEPEDIPEARSATDARIRKDSGVLGEFAARFKRDGKASLEFPTVWAEWCAANDESSDAPAAGGVHKHDFYRRLSAHVEGLRKPTPRTIKGRKVRGWRGWRLLTVEECESEQVIEQAIRGLSADYPGIAFFEIPLGQGALYHSLKRLRDVELLALQDWFRDGRELASALQRSADSVVYYGPEKERMTNEDAMRISYPDLDADRLAGMWLAYNIETIAKIANFNRQLGPVCEQMRERYRKLERTTPGRESVACRALMEADRELGPEVDAEQLARKAVEILDIELGKLYETSPKDANRYDADDVEAAIKELAGLQNRPPAVHR